MNDFEFIDQLTKSPSIKYRIRYFIIALAILTSVGFYRYYIDYFEKEQDFITVLKELLPFNFTTYQFFSHSKPDEVSIYRKFAESFEELADGKINVKIRGQKGNAIENAYGVLNTPKSFGIIQSDTYLSVDFLKNPEKVNIITPLYMERLHIVVSDTSREYKNLKVISAEDPLSIKLIEDAMEKGTFYSGRFNSSGRIILPHLLRQWDIKSSYKLSDLQDIGMKEMIENLKKDDPRLPFPRVAIMFVGSSDYLIQQLLNNEKIGLIGLSPGDVHDLNNLDGVDLDITNFGSIYEKYSNLSTAGAMATLIGSTDLTTSELHNFILTMKEVYNLEEVKKISSNPPVLIDDISDFLEKDRKNKWIVFFRSFLVFFISVVATSFVISTMLLNISSYAKQSNYYKHIYKVYQLVLAKNNSNNQGIEGVDHDVQYQKAIRLIEGMTALDKIAKAVREDYSTGGITTKHHQYLLDNSNHVFNWFETKLVNRLSFVILKIPKEPKREYELKEKILKWHSDGLLCITNFNLLIDKFDESIFQEEV